jgi:hypothetical protein
MRMFVVGDLMCCVYVVMRAVLAGMSMTVRLAILSMNVRVLVLMKVFVPVHMSMRM